MKTQEKAWITPKDIQKYVPDMSIATARKIAKEIQMQMTKEGAYIIKAKSILVPAKRVKDLLGI